jgi:hypothetical protein
MSTMTLAKVRVKPTRRVAKPEAPFGDGVFPNPIVLDSHGDVTLVEDEHFTKSSNPAEEYRFQIRVNGKAVVGFDHEHAGRLHLEMVRSGEITPKGNFIKPEPWAESGAPTPSTRSQVPSPEDRAWWAANSPFAGEGYEIIRTPERAAQGFSRMLDERLPDPEPELLPSGRWA